MASIKADEITKIIREQIENYQQTVAVEEVGSVISVGDGIARVHGLDKVMAGEMLKFPHGVIGIALNLEEDQVGTVLLGEYTEIKEGDTVKRTGNIMSVPVGEALDRSRCKSLSVSPSTARAPSSPSSAIRSSASLPASSIASPSASRCKPASRPSIR